MKAKESEEPEELHQFHLCDNQVELKVNNVMVKTGAMWWGKVGLENIRPSFDVFDAMCYSQTFFIGILMGTYMG